MIRNDGRFSQLDIAVQCSDSLTMRDNPFSFPVLIIDTGNEDSEAPEQSDCLYICHCSFILKKWFKHGPTL